jgi:Fe-S-cluster-containing hydrogenase component 2
MKKLAVKDATVCMACLSCEIACAQAFYKAENSIEQDLSCIHIGLKNDKLKLRYACSAANAPKTVRRVSCT